MQENVCVGASVLSLIHGNSSIFSVAVEGSKTLTTHFNECETYLALFHHLASITNFTMLFNECEVYGLCTFV